MNKEPNVFQRVFNAVTNRTPEQQKVNNDIQQYSNDFLRNGNRKARGNVELDKKTDPELTVNGWMFAALNARKDTFGEFCADNIITTNSSDSRRIHPYLEVIEEKSSQPEIEFWRDIIHDYDMYGEVFIFVLRRVVYRDEEKLVNGQKIKTHVVEHIGLPTAIECLDAKNTKVLKDGIGRVVGYREMVDATHKREFLPEQVIHIVNKHPMDKKRKFSIFDAAQAYQYTINKGAEFAQYALVNSMNTPGMLSTDEILNDEEYDNFRSRINQHQPGEVILADGTGKLTYTPISQEIDKAALPDLTEISRQTIFAVTGTSKTILGIEESGTTRETARVQEKKFIKRTIAPLAKRVTAALNFDFREKYPEVYGEDKLMLEVKAIYDPAETAEQFDTQKKLFDDITEMIYSGYTKESAESFMYGDISFTDLELDSEDAEDIEDEQEDIEGDNDDQEGNTQDSGNDDFGPDSGPDSDDNHNPNDVELENQLYDEYNQTLSDGFAAKALSHHINEQGEMDDYGRIILGRVEKEKKNLLKEIRKVQLDALREADSKVAINSFNEDDIRDKEQETSIFNRLYEIFRKYWMFMIPLIGKERFVQDETTTGLKQDINLLGLNSTQEFINEQARKAAESHTHTIFHDILSAANRGWKKIEENEFVDEYLENYKQGEDKWFKVKPTKSEIKRKLKNPQFIEDNKEIYESVQQKIAQGLDRQTIQREIRNEYINLSRKRANMIVGNELAKSVNQSQYLADYELLRVTNNLQNATKRLVSNTGTPCAICKAIIDQGEIPFTQNFLDLGQTISVEENGKTHTFTADYEEITSGCVHPNCHCRYELHIPSLENNSREMNSNGGGNPYHDAEGKFTNGPSSAFHYDSFSHYSSNTEFTPAKSYSNKEAANKAYETLDGAYRLGVFLETKGDAYVKEVVSKHPDSLSKAITKQTGNLAVVSTQLQKQSSRITKLYNQKSKILSSSNEKEKSLKIDALNKKIDSALKITQAESNKYSSEAGKQISEASLGLLQTLKYLN